jgi:hypothetical protein
VTEIPPHILSRVQFHLKILHRVNADVLRYRALDATLHSGGRYEYEARQAVHADVERSEAFLAQFATLARQHGIDPETVYAAHGGKPVLEPWSEAAQRWRRDS